MLILACGGKSTYFGEYLNDQPDVSEMPDRIRISEVKQAKHKRMYSFTSHVSVYDGCPKQYGFYKEYGFSQHKMFQTSLGSLVHACLEDINNTAFPLMLKDALEQGGYESKIQEIIGVLEGLVERWADIPMLAHTHGQPATPTTMGKEMAVFVARLQEQYDQLMALSFPAKFGGATGGLNAHRAAYPDVDWDSFADNFTASLGLKRSKPTTQIEHYDNLAAIFDCLRRINIILIDLCRDVWSYISMRYFRLKVKETEVGSSAMPHKVNPIDFENAEGNLGLANALLTHLSMKLPISRLQRDLTDSTVLRNIGMPLAYGLIAFNSTLKGLGKISVNKELIDKDLENNWEVVAEGIQTILRREAYPHPYEALKQLTRTGSVMDEVTIKDFIEGLDVAESVKDELRALTPWTY